MNLLVVTLSKSDSLSTQRVRITKSAASIFQNDTPAYVARIRSRIPNNDEASAEIMFNFLDDPRVEIKARNDTYLRGARAYFDGVYFKSGPLTDSI